MTQEIYKVKPRDFIDALSDYLISSNKVKLPENYDILKTGYGREHAPEDRNWYYIRLASIVRKIILKGRVSHGKLAADYGNRKDRGVRPSKKTGAGKYLIDTALKNLESMGWINWSQGNDILTSSAKEILSEIIEKVKE